MILVEQCDTSGPVGHWWSSVALVVQWGVVGWCKSVVYLTSLGRPTDIGLQLGKAYYPHSR